MIFLPKACAAMSTLCAADSPRFALQALHVLEEPVEGEDHPRWRVEATNGRICGIMRGWSRPTANDGLAMPVDRPTGHTEGLVPQAEWKAAMKALATGKKAEGNLAVHLCQNEVLMATSQTVVRAPYPDGRFVEVGAVIPQTPAPRSIIVNPLLLIDLLRVAARLCPDSPQVTLLFWRFDRPMGVTSRSEDGATFDGLIMPLG